MQSLDIQENLSQPKLKEQLPYNPEKVKQMIQKIQEKEMRQEPRKKDPAILDARLEKKLALIPDGE